MHIGNVGWQLGFFQTIGDAADTILQNYDVKINEQADP